MCGIPHHALDVYMQKLIKHGFLVAICEQSDGGPDKIKNRDITRLYVKHHLHANFQSVTPGTLTEENHLEATENNYLAAINFPHDFESNEKAEIGLAWLQISTGEFGMSKSNRMPTFQN
jgi:DNA mismatch repair protein MutS